MRSHIGLITSYASSYCAGIGGLAAPGETKASTGAGVGGGSAAAQKAAFAESRKARFPPQICPKPHFNRVGMPVVKNNNLRLCQGFYQILPDSTGFVFPVSSLNQ